MTPLSPVAVPAPRVRRLRVVDERPRPVQRIVVSRVPAPRVLARGTETVDRLRTG